MLLDIASISSTHLPRMSESDEWAWIAGQAREHLERLRRHGVAHLPVAEVAPPPVVEASAPPVVVGDAVDGRDGAALRTIRDDLGDCRRCKLAPTRKNIVFGVGNPAADLVFVGEAPGANEDAQGEPFVGDAGQLLTRMILAMGWGREDVYIANIIKCRPPGNRNPEPDEIAECEPFLIRQLAALKPRVIVALGKFAAQCLLRKDDTPISALRGKFHEYQGIPVMPTYHPAYLLRTPSAKRMVWDDLQLVMGELARLGVHAPRARAT
jgi:uracil-DNA glycosylase family 4